MCPPVRLQHPSPQARSRPALAEKVAGILATKRQRAHPVFPATSPLAAGSWEYGYGDWGDDGSWGTAPKRFKGMGKGKGVGFQCGGGVEAIIGVAARAVRSGAAATPTSRGPTDVAALAATARHHLGARCTRRAQRELSALGSRTRMLSFTSTALFCN